MRNLEIVDFLAAIPGRGAGTDAERRAALALTREIRGANRQAEIETFWCRPNWALAQSWHVALGLAGSLLAVSHAKVGAGMILVALISVLLDAVQSVSPGRRLTPERASQNVVSPPPGTGHPEVTLIITANYDAGRRGLVYRPALRSKAASAARMTGGRAPGWTGWLTIGLTGVLITALFRVEGHKSDPIAVVQLLITVGLVIALALLLELGSSEWAPAAGDNASGVAVAISLARALDAAPPANAAVALVLSGAGDGQGIGLRRHLRTHRRTRTTTNTIVLGIGPSGAGRPSWLQSDGPLVPMGFFPQLRRLCAEVAAIDPGHDFTAVRSRGCSPALPARMRGIPAITIAAVGHEGHAPNSHLATDVPASLHESTLDTMLQVGLYLVDAIDGYLAELPAR